MLSALSVIRRVAVTGAATLDSLPYNGVVVTLLAVGRAKHHEDYFDTVMAGIVSALIALAAVITSGVHFQIVLNVIYDKTDFGARRDPAP